MEVTYGSFMKVSNSLEEVAPRRPDDDAAGALRGSPQGVRQPATGARYLTHITTNYYYKCAAWLKH